MSRLRSLVTILVPAVLAGGLLFGGALTVASADDVRGGASRAEVGDRDHAHDDADDDGGADARRAARRIADADADDDRDGAYRVPPAPPAPPVPPARGSAWGAPPLPPLPPLPPGAVMRRGGVSVSIHDGKVQVHGIDGFATRHLDAVRAIVEGSPDLSPEVRAKVLERLDRTRGGLERRLRSLAGTDVDNLGRELEKVGEEIEQSMEGLEDELEKLGERVSKDLAKRLTRDLARGFGPGGVVVRVDGLDGLDGDDADGHDDDGVDVDVDAVVVGPDVDAAVDVRALRVLQLRPAQRDQIVKLRAAMDRDMTVARKQLGDAERRLEAALRDVRSSDADIARYVDQVSQHEAAIRKARLLAWVATRRLLDDAQRKQIEDAAQRQSR